MLAASGMSYVTVLGYALAASRNGDTLVVTKPDRLARSLPDARNIAAINRLKL